MRSSGRPTESAPRAAPPRGRRPRTRRRRSSRGRPRGPTRSPARRTRAVAQSARSDQKYGTSAKGRAAGRRSPRRPPGPARGRPPSARSACGAPCSTESYSHVSPARPDAARRGRERRRARHAAGLAQLEARRAREHHVRHRAGAHHDEVGVDGAPRLGARRAATRLVPSKPLERRRRSPARPRARAAASAKNAPAGGPKCVESGASSTITIVQRLPSCGQRRRDLAGDVGAADQHDALGLLGVGADRVGVAERAQVVDALELGAPSTRSRRTLAPVASSATP